MESYQNKFDLSDQSQWLRGKTPEDIKEQCFDFCRQYLAGVWLEVTVDQIVVNRITGGLTNQLYYCAIDDNASGGALSGRVPREVAIRLYGDKHFNNEEVNERLNDIIIGVMVSQNNSGPKVYGLFEQGQIMAFHKHRNFRGKEQEDPKLVDQLARILARVHAMQVPIKRTGNWINNNFEKWIKEAYDRFDIDKIIDEYNCETLKKYKIKQELDWLLKTVAELDSPVTFTHVDFRGSNIMVTEPDDRILLCDFEYSGYGYRGSDFGTIFAEWNGRVWADFTTLHDFPEDNQIIPFLESYVEESSRLLGESFAKDKRNSFDHLLKEVKLFSLVSNMFFVLLTLKTNKNIRDPTKTFDKRTTMVFSDLNYKNYHHLKNKFIKQNIF